MELQKLMDNFLHVDASLNRATGGSFFQLKDGIEPPLETPLGWMMDEKKIRETGK